MMPVLEATTLILTVLALVPALAHVLEFPGKLRLTKEAYFGVQKIYYPGFTIAGVFEPLAIIATTALLVLTPRSATIFGHALTALIALVAMHGVYWLVTHPVNKFWLQGEKLSESGSTFFAVGSPNRSPKGESSPDWKTLRNRWEYSHLARAGLGAVSFVALVIAVSMAET